MSHQLQDHPEQNSVYHLRSHDSLPSQTGPPTPTMRRDSTLSTLILSPQSSLSSFPAISTQGSMSGLSCSQYSYSNQSSSLGSQDSYSTTIEEDNDVFDAQSVAATSMYHSLILFVVWLCSGEIIGNWPTGNLPLAQSPLQAALVRFLNIGMQNS